LIERSLAQPAHEHTDHEQHDCPVCYDGLLFLGQEIQLEDGTVEEITRVVPCRRCNKIQAEERS
jgi:hypothetical protein